MFCTERVKRTSLFYRGAGSFFAETETFWTVLEFLVLTGSRGAKFEMDKNSRVPKWVYLVQSIREKVGNLQHSKYERSKKRTLA